MTLRTGRGDDAGQIAAIHEAFVDHARLVFLVDTYGMAALLNDEQKKLTSFTNSAKKHPLAKRVAQRVPIERAQVALAVAYDLFRENDVDGYRMLLNVALRMTGFTASTKVNGGRLTQHEWRDLARFCRRRGIALSHDVPEEDGPLSARHTREIRQKLDANGLSLPVTAYEKLRIDGVFAHGDLTDHGRPVMALARLFAVDPGAVYAWKRKRKAPAMATRRSVRGKPLPWSPAHDRDTFIDGIADLLDRTVDADRVSTKRLRRR